MDGTRVGHVERRDSTDSCLAPWRTGKGRWGIPEVRETVEMKVERRDSMTIPLYTSGPFPSSTVGGEGFLPEKGPVSVHPPTGVGVVMSDILVGGSGFRLTLRRPRTVVWSLFLCSFLQFIKQVSVVYPVTSRPRTGVRQPESEVTSTTWSETSMIVMEVKYLLRRLPVFSSY